jgi:hypothetical protein
MATALALASLRSVTRVPSGANVPPDAARAAVGDEQVALGIHEEVGDDRQG